MHLYVTVALAPCHDFWEEKRQKKLLWNFTILLGFFLSSAKICTADRNTMSAIMEIPSREEEGAKGQT